jgi:hypothetical protein
MPVEMRAGEVVSVQRAKARWAYSEIRSPRLTAVYQRNPRVLPLYGKVTTSAFEDLSEFEVDALVEIFETARGRLLNHYWSEVREFVLEEWSADQLGQVYAMSEADPWRQGRFHPFAVYAKSPRPTGPKAGRDPRVAADHVPLTTTLPELDPLVVGLYKDLRVLIDGYFRGLIFMRSAASGGRVAILVPVPR